jgi:hypothetical protein
VIGFMLAAQIRLTRGFLTNSLAVMMKATLFCLLLVTTTAYARLGETVQEVETRYGKPLRNFKSESPATVAKVYEKNGFRIIVGFYQDKSYYEQFWKPDPKKPNSFLPISETERETLLRANCAGCQWEKNTPIFTSGGDYYETTYNRSDGLVRATYDDGAGRLMFTIRSLQKEIEDKQREKENLKGF